MFLFRHALQLVLRERRRSVAAALGVDGSFWFQTGTGTRRAATSPAIRGVRSRCRSATRTS